MKSGKSILFAIRQIIWTYEFFSYFWLVMVMAQYHICPDGELLALLQNGDHSALKEIYGRYWKPLYYSAYNVLKDEDASQDIVQEIFISLWQRHASLAITTSLKGYLFTAVRYQVYKEVRKNAPERLFTDLDERMSSWNGDSQLLLAEIEQMVRQAVEKLPDGCREIYILSREEGLSHAEIAERLDISTKTVANQMTKALRHIRTSLGQFFPLLFLFTKF